MAQKIQTLFIDDIDGSAAEGTVRFGLDGTNYEIDLSAAHAADGPRSSLSAGRLPGRRRGVLPGRAARRPPTALAPRRSVSGPRPRGSRSRTGAGSRPGLLPGTARPPEGKQRPPVHSLACRTKEHRRPQAGTKQESRQACRHPRNCRSCADGVPDLNAGPGDFPGIAEVMRLACSAWLPYVSLRKSCDGPLVSTWRETIVDNQHRIWVQLVSSERVSHAPSVYWPCAVPG
jgi:Lsr2